MRTDTELSGLRAPRALSPPCAEPPRALSRRQEDRYYDDPYRKCPEAESSKSGGGGQDQQPSLGMSSPARGLSPCCAASLLEGGVAPASSPSVTCRLCLWRHELFQAHLAPASTLEALLLVGERHSETKIWTLDSIALEGRCFCVLSQTELENVSPCIQCTSLFLCPFVYLSKITN